MIKTEKCALKWEQINYITVVKIIITKNKCKLKL